MPKKHKAQVKYPPAHFLLMYVISEEVIYNRRGYAGVMFFKYMKCCLLVAFLGLQAACSGGGGEDNSGSGQSVPGKAPSSDNQAGGTMEERLDALLMGQARSSAGVSVLVMKDGEVLYHKSKGMANSYAGIEIGNSTGFRLASVSKSFTALAVMQLVETGQLSLDEPIRNLIPELPQSWLAITVEMLLTHRGGHSGVRWLTG